MKDVLIDIISERKSSGPFSREILGKTLLTRGGARVELRAHTRGFALEKAKGRQSRVSAKALRETGKSRDGSPHLGQWTIVTWRILKAWPLRGTTMRNAVARST